MAQPQAQAQDGGFLGVPSAARWEELRPVVEELYRTTKLPDLIEVMKQEYRFNADARQYKYHFKKWGTKKSVPGEVKEQALMVLGKRSRAEFSTPVVSYKGEGAQIAIEVDKKRLRRHGKMMHRAMQQLCMSKDETVFLDWGLPYKALLASIKSTTDKPSPFAKPDTPRSELALTGDTIFGLQVVSPRGPESPATAPTPTTRLLADIEMSNRVNLLLQGQHQEFMAMMPKSDRPIAATWLHQFWMFTYKTVKHWGRGPKAWAPSMLKFDEFQDQFSSVNTPQAIGDSPLVSSPSSNPDSRYRQRKPQTRQLPSPLCLWSIHISNTVAYEPLPETQAPVNDDPDPDDEDSWSLWPRSKDDPPVIAKLLEALEENSFSSLDIDDLPLSASQIVKAAQRSPDQLLEETIGFAIIAGNINILCGLAEECEYFEEINLTRIRPFYLAASYLVGAKSCCNMMEFTVRNFLGDNSIRKLYIDDLQHTVLDALMMRILGSHTSCSPETADSYFRGRRRFAGEEVDICGRWDADSTYIRRLWADGKPAIPLDWKHMFCHTSIQAICHSISTIFGPYLAPDIDTVSGLFVRRCTSCGLKMLMRPLHCLVLVVFHLAQQGRPGETLFGAIACLVCMLVNGSDPRLAANISINSLMNAEDEDVCSHSEMTPLELAVQVPLSLVFSWSLEVQLGWVTFCRVLRFMQDERERSKSQKEPLAGANSPGQYDAYFMAGEAADEELASEDAESDNGDHCEHYKPNHSNFYGESKELGIFWAAIQAELVTYRRVKETDPWISSNFPMSSIAWTPDGRLDCSEIPLIKYRMIKEACVCGRFCSAVDEACPTVKEVSQEYFSNMDIWARAEYIDVPSDRRLAWYDRDYFYY